MNNILIGVGGCIVFVAAFAHGIYLLFMVFERVGKKYMEDDEK